ncbi:helix-turn-helix transcriptional regulator [Candidatus Uhrbacteria bacterium]|nr:helix-turn-helix transcriptional regulator [Candidatus Uhrbacteria bacterium]
MAHIPHAPHQIFFETLGNQARWDIVHLLNREKAISATRIAKKLKLEQSLASHHLRRLELCGFVRVVQRGRERHYFLNRETVGPLLKLMDRHISKFCKRCKACV